jgi:protein-disulfide isomerase
MKIILFGTGCDSCRQIAHHIETAIAMVDHKITFEKTSDLHQMLSYGIKSTPSVVINDQIISVSEHLSLDDILAFIDAIGSSEYRN